MNVSVIGTGYVGLVTGVVLAHLGHQVVCIDNQPAKVEMLRKGISPIYEPGIEEMIAEGLASGNLVISDSIAEGIQKAEIIFIAVGTPPAEDGAPDLTAVYAVATQIGKHLRHRALIVSKSTVPVGTGKTLENVFLEQGANPAHFDIASNPEFLREGTAIYDTLNPDRIVIGASRPEAADKLVELYKDLKAPVLITDVVSAELIKYGANAFLAAKISFINAMSRLCERTGADVGDVAKGIGADRRIGESFLGAGLGWGGSCFPKDVKGLYQTAARLGYDFGFLREVMRINDEQTHHFIDRLEARLGGLAGRRIGLLGLAFKANTDDIRDAKSLIIIDRILAQGGTVVAYDPIAGPHVKAKFEELELVDDVKSLADGADALILVTEWPEFKHIDWNRIRPSLRNPVLFDGRRFFRRAEIEHAGFEYFTIGS